MSGSSFKSLARLSLVAMLALHGCAKEEPKGEVPIPGDKPVVLIGPLAETVNSIQRNKYREACDETNRYKMREVAKALDERRDAILAFGAAEPAAADDAWKAVPLGPTQVYERIKPLATKPGWETSAAAGWSDIYADYEKIKDKPVGPEWLALNRFARGVLVDDVDRVQNGANFHIDQTMEPMLASLAKTVSDCFGDAACVKFTFSAEQAAFISSQPLYRDYLKAMEDASEADSKRKWVTTFGLRIKADSRQFSFRRNDLVEQTSPGVFEVPMDAGPFAGVAERLGGYIESIWAADGKQVKVKWKDQASYPDIYRIVLGTSVGERAYVSQANREMKLFPFVRSRSIAHETGHVLGFPDVYFTIWDEAACSYKQIVHVESLMGDSGNGVVLPAHWAELEKQYPLK